MLFAYWSVSSANYCQCILLFVPIKYILHITNCISALVESTDVPITLVAEVELVPTVETRIKMMKISDNKIEVNHVNSIDALSDGLLGTSFVALVD